MKEEWLFHGAVVPIDVETTAALVAEIKRLIDVIGGMALAQPEQDAGYVCVDGYRHPAAFIHTTPPKREWVGLTEEQFLEAARLAEDGNYLVAFQRIQQWLKEKNT